VREVREDAREVDFVASTETVDSYGEIVKQNWRFERFAVNPVILFAHDSRSLPIGHATKFAVENNELRITVKFSTARANPFAELCFQSVLEKALRGGSVGFKPNTIRYEKHNERDVCVLDDNELYEFSVCPLPANPDGLAQLEQRMAKLFGQTMEAFAKSHSFVPTKPVDAQPKNKEGRVPDPKKKTIGDAELGELRARGTCLIKCDCGVDTAIELPVLAKMDEDVKVLSAKVVTLEGDLATSKKSLEDIAKQAVVEKRTIEVKAEIDVLVKADKLLPDEIEDLVALGVEKPERYAARMKQLRERAPLNAPNLTTRVNLGAEADPQRGAAGTVPSADETLVSLGAEMQRSGLLPSATMTDPDSVLLSL
jgi:HK97 family phage prohead protease